MRIARAALAAFVGMASLVGLAVVSTQLDEVGNGGAALAAPPVHADEHACLEPAGEKTDRLHCFTSLGPIHFSGRVRALVIRPDDPNTIWTATASGGLWFTHDAGNTWSHSSDVMRTL